MSNYNVPPRRSRGLLPRAALVLALVPAAACDLGELLSTEDRFTVTTPVARDTTNLVNTYAGAISQFALAMGGRHNREGGLVTHVGIFTDELYSADGFKDFIDLRDLDPLPSTSEEISASFIRLQRARNEAVGAAALFGSTSQATSPRRAELYNLAAYSVVGLAENFCSGVPLGLISDEGFTYGAPLTTQQLFQQALAYFDSAAALAAAGSVELHTAWVGKARVLLDMGDFQQAGVVAAQVPNSFTGYLAQYNASSQETENAVYQLGTLERRFGASRSEGTVHQGLPYDDPRTPRSSTPLRPYSGNVGDTVYVQLKYNSFDADIPVANAYEARLIQAEAALRAGQTAQFQTLLNQARALQSQPALPESAFQTDVAGLVDVLFRERAYGLWLTAHRLSDLRRLIRQYGRTEDQVFPTGSANFGNTYGDDVVFPIPFSELNNPNFQGCLSEEA
jgi:starch-binding outer membrane protein, SusD/RagB family